MYVASAPNFPADRGKLLPRYVSLEWLAIELEANRSGDPERFARMAVAGFERAAHRDHARRN
jgi:hypothetical protein